MRHVGELFKIVMDVTGGRLQSLLQRRPQPSTKTERETEGVKG
jgi:hypothetical protein